MGTEINNDFVTLGALAQELGIHKVNVRRYVEKIGYKPHYRRGPPNNRRLMCLTRDEADQIRVHRADNGFAASVVLAVADVGVFYVIQLVPELCLKRLKLGFTECLDQRVLQHRTAAPTLRVLRAWPCKRAWETAAIDALTRPDCRLILNEVFECSDPDALLTRGDAFFGMLPKPGDRTELANASPLNGGE